MVIITTLCPTYVLVQETQICRSSVRSVPGVHSVSFRPLRLDLSTDSHTRTGSQFRIPDAGDVGSDYPSSVSIRAQEVLAQRNFLVWLVILVPLSNLRKVM